MSADAGSVFVRLGAIFERKGFEEYDRAHQKADAKAKRPIEQKLAAVVDQSSFRQAEQKFENFARKAREKFTVRGKVEVETRNAERKLDAVIKEANQLDRELRKQKRVTVDSSIARARLRDLRKESRDLANFINRPMTPRVDDRGVNRLGGVIGRVNRQFTFTRNLLSVMRWPVLIKGLQLAAANAVSLTSSLAPLSGALVAYPGFMVAAAQGSAVWKLATGGLSEAVGGLNEELDEESEAFKRLSPEAQKFARYLQAVKPAIRGLQETAQQGLFPGLREGLQDAMQNLPVIERVVGRTARALGSLAGGAGRALGSARWGRDLERMGNTNVVVLTRLGRAAGHVADALRHVGVAAGPTLRALARDLQRGAERLADWAKEGRRSGDLGRFFERSRAKLWQVWNILKDVGGILLNVGRAARRSGDSMVNSIGQVLERWRAWTGSVEGQDVLRRYFAKARRQLAALTRFLGDQARIWASPDMSLGQKIAASIERLRLGEALARLVQDAMPVMAREMSAAAPGVLSAFVQGWMEAPLAGKIITAAWLLGTLGLGSAVTSAAGSAAGQWIATWLATLRRNRGTLAAGTAAATAVGGAAGGAAGAVGDLVQRVWVTNPCLPVTDCAPGKGGGGGRGGRGGSGPVIAPVPGGASGGRGGILGWIRHWGGRFLRFVGGKVLLPVGIALAVGQMFPGVRKWLHDRVVDLHRFVTKSIPKGLKVAVRFIGQKVGAVWRDVKATVGKVVRFIGRTVGGVWRWAGRTIGKVVRFIGRTVGRIWRTVRDAVSKAVRFVGRTVGRIWRTARDAVNKAVKFIGETAGKLWRTAKDTWEKVVKFAAETAGRLWRTARDVWEKVIKFVGETAGVLWRDARKTWDKTIRFIGVTWGSLWRTAGRTINKFVRFIGIGGRERGGFFEQGGFMGAFQEGGTAQDMTQRGGVVAGAPMGVAARDRAGNADVGPGEAVLTGQQQSYVQRALALAKQMGEVAYGSLEELFANVTTPHWATAAGEHMGAFQGGGRPYVPGRGGFVRARIGEAAWAKALAATTRKYARLADEHSQREAERAGRTLSMWQSRYDLTQEEFVRDGVLSMPDITRRSRELDHLIQLARRIVDVGRAAVARIRARGGNPAEAHMDVFEAQTQLMGLQQERALLRRSNWPNLLLEGGAPTGPGVEWYKEQAERFARALRETEAAFSVFRGAGDIGAGPSSGLLMMRRGGVVPGMGYGDMVPAMLQPGERVMTREAQGAHGEVLDAVERAAQRQGLGGARGAADGREVQLHTHWHSTFPPTRAQEREVTNMVVSGLSKQGARVATKERMGL